MHSFKVASEDLRLRKTSLFLFSSNFKIFTSGKTKSPMVESWRIENKWRVHVVAVGRRSSRVGIGLRLSVTTEVRNQLRNRCVEPFLTSSKTIDVIYLIFDLRCSKA